MNQVSELIRWAWKPRRNNFDIWSWLRSMYWEVFVVCHYDQIRFPGIPVRRCRFSGIGVDGNAFHRLKTCHKSSYLSHLSSKQLFLIDTYRLKKYLSTGWHGSSSNFYIHSLIQFCCLFIRSKSWKHFFANMSNSGMVW